MNKSYKITKRFIDLTLSLILIIILLPVIFVISILVLIFNGRPIIFSQIRPGLNEKPFKLFKFRTMINQPDQENPELTDGERITKLGNFLRNSSMDELPTLWNVFIGDMSFIGPRPLLMKYLSRYDQFQRRRHDVKPGISGWAQVNGRNLLSWDDKFELDIWYIENQSLILDFRIFLKTIQKVIVREGISSKDQATAEEFKG
tara:strand:- start:730 stop:1335 length:606 start_codon:yes stop_codon:yes gene_type:complete